MTYRILLVEDDEQICETICDYFSAQSEGICTVDTVHDGMEGLDAARSGGYDLILLDIMLPGMDGFSVCRSLRAGSDVPLLFLTARAREEDVLYGYTLGCDDYIIKPVSLAAKEFALLQFLMEHREWVVSREQLLDRIWGSDFFGSDRVVDTHIKKLRKALGSAGKQIHTVISKGYQLKEK